MKILAIESSCDDTSVAIVNDSREILSNIVLSQLEEHKPFKGVVPEIAARAHMGNIEYCLELALDKANIKLEEVDAIAATTGPGLIGGVIVGTMFAKGLSAALNKPFIAVNHLEGHALTARLTNNVAYPYLLLLVSGGHCQFVEVKDLGSYKILGQTLDDAVGEAFDKVAKMLGLGYPGGPIVEKMAKEGNEKRFEFPLSMIGRAGCDMSFSGLKTAVRKEIISLGENISEQDKADICASFQYVISTILAKRTEKAIRLFQQNHDSTSFVLAGGVAANMYLREKLQKTLAKYDFKLEAIPLGLCTDNAAMIAWAAIERFQKGITNDLATAPKARWSLEEL